MCGVGVICFVSCYAIAWALELSRLAFRSGVRGALMLGFTAAGLLAHTVFLYYRAINAEGAPLSSEKDWFLIAAWGVAVVSLSLSFAHRKIPFGMFLLPIAMGLIAMAAGLASPEPLAREPASRLWGAVHGCAILAAAVTVLVGFVAGLMYLFQERRLKRRRLPEGRLRLPSQEWLQRINSRSIVGSAILLGIGIAAGMILNLTDERRLPWSDSLLLSTWLMFAWLIGAVALIAVYRPAGRGRKVAWLTVAGFVFLAIVLGVGLLVENRHWGRDHRPGLMKRLNDGEKLGYDHGCHCWLAQQCSWCSENTLVRGHGVHFSRRPALLGKPAVAPRVGLSQISALPDKPTVAPGRDQREAFAKIGGPSC